jgi:hypothetical protein
VEILNTYVSQTAKDVRASQDTLVDIFERIESFFRRLEMYIEVPRTAEMVDTIILGSFHSCGCNKGDEARPNE